jgi:hypothetical protein
MGRKKDNNQICIYYGRDNCVQEILGEKICKGGHGTIYSQTRGNKGQTRTTCSYYAPKHNNIKN